MDDNSRESPNTGPPLLGAFQLHPHRQYEALRAFFVHRLPSAEAAARFGFSPGSFRVLVHQFRSQPDRDFFAPPHARAGLPPNGNGCGNRSSPCASRTSPSTDISRALARDGEALSPAAVAAILKEEGFAKLPRRVDDERPEQPRPRRRRDRRCSPSRPDTTPPAYPVRRPVPVLPLADRRRLGHAPGAVRLPRLRDDSRRLYRSVAPGSETLRRCAPFPRHERCTRRRAGSLRWLECHPQAIVPDRVQLPGSRRRAIPP